jgi:hypothetical protein
VTAPSDLIARGLDDATGQKSNPLTEGAAKELMAVATSDSVQQKAASNSVRQKPVTISQQRRRRVPAEPRDAMRYEETERLRLAVSGGV